MGGDELVMGGTGIPADTDNDDAMLVEFRLQITEAGGLLDSAGGVVLGIKKQ